jgi:aspartate-semialdehyde dehydrogenase
MSSKAERPSTIDRLTLVGVLVRTLAFSTAYGILLEIRLMPIASPRSAGADLNPSLGLRRRLDAVRTIDEVDWHALDVAFFTAGAGLSHEVVLKAAAAGCLVIDNTSAFRQTPGVPLVVPQVNGHLLNERPAPNIVANPNCSTIQLVRVLAPLHRVIGLRRVMVATYQAASGGGTSGLAELAGRSLRLLGDAAAPEDSTPGKFGPSLAFNVIPQIGPIGEDGITNEERKIRQETRTILDAPELDISASAVRVPVFQCHSETVWADLERAVPAAQVAQVLSEAPELRVYGPEMDPPYPMPTQVYRTSEDRALVHVGRVRREPDHPRTVMLWIVADNTWVGAALNAADILSTVITAGWLEAG